MRELTTSYKDVFLTRSNLELLFRHNYPTWKTALSSVAGVYLISDIKTGKLYVGSAYGKNGFWGRWLEYFSTFHGANRKMKQLYDAEGSEGFSDFRYSILETCDIDLAPEKVIEIEKRWKDRLISREYGYNDN